MYLTVLFSFLLTSSNIATTFITDRVHSTWEGYVLTRVCPSVCLSTGGGYPSQVQPGGYPCQGGGIPPGTGQQMEYLIRRSQYASCVHVGGLSCSLCKIMQFRSVISASLPLESAAAKTSLLCHKKTGSKFFGSSHHWFYCISMFFIKRILDSLRTIQLFYQQNQELEFPLTTIGKIPPETAWKRFKILDHFIVPRKKSTYLYFLMTTFGIKMSNLFWRFHFQHSKILQLKFGWKLFFFHA